jgi:hypothetical protein
MKVRAGKGVWAKWGGPEGKTVVAVLKSDTNPNTDEEIPGEGWTPLYPASRVTGDTYEYYNGRSEWEVAANAAMSSEANSNFRRGQSF